MGMEEAEIETIQSQIMEDEFDIKQLQTKIVSYLIHKVEVIADPTDIKNLDQIQEVYTSQKQKLLGL